MNKVVYNLQRFLTYGIPCLLFISVWFGMTQSADKQIVFIPYSLDDQESVDVLREEGYLQNPLMYAAVSTAIELGFDIEPGGFELSNAMGPFSMLAALTSPEYKYVSFYEGLRKEEIADIVGDKLDWNEQKRKIFAKNEPLCTVEGGEGYLYAGTYIVHKDESPIHVRKRMEREMQEVLNQIVADEKDSSVKHDVVTIASLIQREAAGKHDMNIISGVIQNRIDKNMPLQIDATLQYAKASEENTDKDEDEEVWWPIVGSDDKYIDSPFNTYQYKGLPPAPIASPGKSALAAAADPIDTNCLFYIHDNNRTIHCASDYEQHKANIRHYLQ